jgi:hypothetical protein
LFRGDKKLLNLFKRNKKNLIDEKILQSKYSCKYVKQAGKTIGESILVKDNHLIVKTETRTIAIPLEAIINATEDDVIVKDFNEEEARKLGEEWERAHTNKLEFDEHGMLITEKAAEQKK